MLSIFPLSLEKTQEKSAEGWRRVISRGRNKSTEGWRRDDLFYISNTPRFMSLVCYYIQIVISSRAFITKLRNKIYEM
jgi:hypothetical protein